MRSYNRRQQNSNSDNLVFLTPVTGTDTRKSKSQYRSQINSYPNFNKQQYPSSNSNIIKPEQISSNVGLSYARKRRGESSTKNTKEVVPAIDDEPGSKRRKPLIPETTLQPVVPSYFELVIFFQVVLYL